MGLSAGSSTTNLEEYHEVLTSVLVLGFSIRERKINAGYTADLRSHLVFSGVPGT